LTVPTDCAEDSFVTFSVDSHVSFRSHFNLSRNLRCESDARGLTHNQVRVSLSKQKEVLFWFQSLDS